MLKSRLLFAAVLLLSLALLAPRVHACLFCSEQRGATLTDDFAKAEIVIVGTCINPKIGANGFDDSSTEIVIDEVVKSHEAIKGKKKIILPRYIAEANSKHVFFIDVYKGNLDFYRSLQIASDSAIVKYLKGALVVQDKKQPERLRYFFDYLNFPEFEIALDAYREYAKADYKDYEAMAKSLPKATLVTWFTDPKTPSYRLGLFASLLGHCGGPDEAKLLKAALDDPEKNKGSGVDGIMAGLVMIDPKGGWEYLSKRMLDEDEDFTSRYCAFRTAKFLWDTRTDLVPKETLIKSVGGLIDSKDMADFAIDQLRKWQRWEYTQSIGKLWGKESHNLNVIKRSIGRFMLRSPEPAAAAFIAEQRRRDPEWVKDVMDLLSLEPN